MSRPRNANAGVAPGATHDTEQQASPKRSAHRPEVQGTATQRNRDQRPPQWDAPAGEAAAQALDKALKCWTALLGEPAVDPKRWPR
jgi:hypothetical protein